MRKILNSAVTIIGSIFAIIIVLNIFLYADVEDYFCKKSFLFSNRAMIIIALFTVLLGVFFIKKAKLIKILEATNKRTLLVASVMVLLLQLVIAWSIYFEAGWDCWAIVDTSRSFVEGTLRNGSYFGTYPNNIVLMGIFAVILKVVSAIGIENGYFVLVVINVILLNLAGLMVSDIIYKVTSNKKIVCIGWMCYTILGSLSGWMVIPYSDVWALFFVALSIYIYSKINDQSRWFLWCLLGVIFFVGTQIKPTVMIGLIAIVITEILTKHKENKKSACKMGILVVTFLSLTMIFSKSTDMVMGSMGVNTEQRVTFMHYLMMGLQEETLGAISGEDLSFSTQIETVRERKEANLRVAKERLEKFGVIGYIEFLQKKLLMNTNDGSFAWGLEGEFYKVIPEETTPASKLLRNIYYNQGSYYDIDSGSNHQYMLSFQQIIWLCMLISIGGVSINKRETDSPLGMVAILSIIGILIFTLLFEGRARYLYLSLPMFTIAMAIGLQRIARIKWRKSEDEIR